MSSTRQLPLVGRHGELGTLCGSTGNIDGSGLGPGIERRLSTGRMSLRTLCSSAISTLEYHLTSTIGISTLHNNNVEGIMRNEKESGLLKLLNERKAWEAPRLTLISFDPDKVKAAAQAAARANDSDPFVYGRTVLHLSKGYELPSDVLRESHSKIKLRANEPKEALEKLSPVRKQMEERRLAEERNKAWNQYRAAKFIEEKVA